MDVIYYKNADLDEEKNFSIDLTANNEIDGMFFKNEEEYLISGLEIKNQPVDLQNGMNFQPLKRFQIELTKQKKTKKMKLNTVRYLSIYQILTISKRTR